MTNVPSNTHRNKELLKRRSEIEIREAEFYLLPAYMHRRFFDSMLDMLSPGDKEIARPYLADMRVIELHASVLERMRKMYLHHVTAGQIQMFRRQQWEQEVARGEHVDRQKYPWVTDGS